MKMKHPNSGLKGMLVLIALTTSCLASAREMNTAEGSSGDRAYACKLAKSDAERQARNDRSVVTDFGQCQCSEQKAYSSWYCTVDFSMEKKKK